MFFKNALFVGFRII